MMPGRAALAGVKTLDLAMTVAAAVAEIEVTQVFHPAIRPSDHPTIRPSGHPAIRPSGR
jgi:hypothetical protein